MKRFRFILLIAGIVAAVAVAVLAVADPSKFAFLPDLKLTGGPLALTGAITLAVCCILLCLTVMRGKTTGRQIFGEALLTLAWYAFAALLGMLPVFVKSLQASGAIYTIAAGCVALILFVLFYFKRRSRAAKAASSSAIRRSASGSGEVKHAYSVLYGNIILMLAAGAYFFIAAGDNKFLLVPLAVTALAVIIWRLSGWRGILLPAIMTVAAYGGIVAVTTAKASVTPVSGFPSDPFVLAYAVACYALLLPLTDLYTRQEQNI